MFLARDAERYIEIHRRLGYKYDTEQRWLAEYAKFASEAGDEWIRIERVMQWISRSVSRYQSVRKLRLMRNFAIWMRAEDHRHELPPRDAFGRHSPATPSPHLLTRGQIRQVMDAALELPPAGSISPYTWHYLFGLMAVTGLRVSEALALQLRDVTPDGLAVRETKFRKSRLVPLHKTTRDALHNYIELRERFGGFDDHLFVLSTGRPPNPSGPHNVFVSLLRKLNLRGGIGEKGPRLHDLRHSFSVYSLETIPEGRNESAHLMALATYLGHASPDNTYWYLKPTPPVMKRIAEAAETAQLGRITK